MIVHYLNASGQERFICDVVHLQNVDDITFEAHLKSGKILTLKTERIEGILSEEVEEERNE